MRIRCRSDLVAALLLVGALAACKPGAGRPDEGALEPVGAARVALEKAACEADGGRWTGDGGGGLICLRETRDGGRSCTSGADCESACLARSRTCAPVMPLVGCNEVITSSGLRVTECVN